MAVIALFPNCAFLSETSRMLAIAQALRSRGEEVVVASHGGPYEGLLDESHIPWQRLRPVMDPTASFDFLQRLLTMGLGGRPFLSQEFVRRAVVEETSFLRDIKAHIIVTGFTLTAYLSSRVAKIPMATSHGGSYVAPVFERGLAPASVNPPLRALGLLPKKVNRYLANVIPPRLAKPVAFLNEMARELGVERVPGMAAMLLGDLTLVTDVPEVLGIPREELESWRPHSPHYRPSTTLRYVGPLYAQLELDIPAEVDEFLEKPGPIVYLAPTSVTRDFLVKLVNAVRKADVRVLVGATIHDIRDLADERICIAGVLPSHRIMPRVDLAVIMGGQGSVQCAMAAGTPCIGFPHHAEQELNLALAERQGMALRLPPSSIRTTRFTQAVGLMLDDAVIKENAVKVRSLYEHIDGASQAADAILAYTEDYYASPASW